VKPGDTFYASRHDKWPRVLWRVLTKPAEEGGRGPLFVWAEPIRPLCARRRPEKAVFYCRDIRIEEPTDAR
jgi:hypothetical protein